MSKIKDYIINKKAKHDREEFEYFDRLFSKYSKKEMRQKLKELKKNDTENTIV